MQVLHSSPVINNPYIAAALQFPGQVAQHAPAVRKVGQLVARIIEAVSYAQGTNYLPGLVRSISYTNSFIGFYDSFKDGVYWLTPFPVQNIDQVLFANSLEEAMDMWTPAKLIVKTDVKQIIEGTLKKNPRNAEQARYALEYTLVENGYSWLQAVRVSHSVQIALKPTKPIQSVTKAFATMWVFGANLSTLQSWNLINLAQLSHQIGSQAPVLQFVEQVALKTVMKVLGGVTLSLVFLQVAYKMASIQLQIYNKATPSHEDETVRKQALWDFAYTTVDCASYALPLALPLSVPVLMGLGIAANSFGVMRCLRSYRNS